MKQEIEKKFEKIIETKTWIFEISKNDETSGKTMLKIKNYNFPLGMSGMREVTSLQILQILKKIIKEYYEQLHLITCKKFLDGCKPSKFT